MCNVGSAGKPPLSFAHAQAGFKDAKTVSGKVDALRDLEKAAYKDGAVDQEELKTFIEDLTSMGDKIQSSPFNPSHKDLNFVFGEVKAKKGEDAIIKAQNDRDGAKSHPILAFFENKAKALVQEGTDLARSSGITKIIPSSIKVPAKQFINTVNATRVGVDVPLENQQIKQNDAKRASQIQKVLSYDPVTDESCVGRSLEQISKSIKPQPSPAWKLPTDAVGLNPKELNKITSRNDWSVIDPKKLTAENLTKAMKGQEGKAIVEINGHAYVYKGVDSKGVVSYEDPAKLGITQNCDKSKIVGIYKMDKKGHKNYITKNHSYVSPKDMKPSQVDGKTENNASFEVRRAEASILDPMNNKPRSILSEMSNIADSPAKLEKLEKSNPAQYKHYKDLFSDLNKSIIGNIPEDKLQALAFKYTARTSVDSRIGNLAGKDGKTSLLDTVKWLNSPAAEKKTWTTDEGTKVSAFEARTNLLSRVETAPKNFEDHETHLPKGNNISDQYSKKGEQDIDVTFDMMIGRDGC